MVQFSKTSKDGVDALLVNRNDGVEPQAFTRAELEGIRVNTIAHSVSLASASEGEKKYYLEKDADGLSFIDKALRENEQMEMACDDLGVAL